MITRSSTIIRSGRVLQVEGMFDVPPATTSTVSWDPHLPLAERSWNVGLIVGRSGSGKSTVARETFGNALVESYPWPADRCILDGFPEDADTTDITAALSYVGFASPPEWLRPFHVLSTGQQFRVTVARAMIEAGDPIVIDEFTSTVDRTVAQVGSAAIAKAIRRAGRRFVAVTCHYDVLDWLQPDWVYEPESNAFIWRSLQRRPAISLDIEANTLEAWELFKPYHYLTADYPSGARLFTGWVDGQPVATVGMMSNPMPTPTWRVTRLVVLPEWQGAGVVLALLTHVAELYQGGRPVRITTGHPGLIRGLHRHPRWTMHREPSRVQPSRSTRDLARRLRERGSRSRLTATFELIATGKGPFAAGWRE